MDNYLYSDRAGVYSCQGGVVKAEFLFTDRRYFLNFLTLDETSLNFSEGMYFGEYFSNPSFLPVFIWFRSKSGAWSKVFSFEEGAINHIHNLYHDPIDNFVWILTGDFDNGPALWRADDNFNDVVKVTPAEQKYRACWIKRFSDNIYWATDTQMEQNSLLKANAKDIEPSVIKKLPGSSIYSVAFNGGVAFSTTLEPERASRRDFMAWLDNKPARKLEPDGAAVYILDEDEVLVEIIRSSPHLLPLRLFEYPTYLFPSNIVESKYLTCYGRSVKSNDDCLLVFKTSI